MSEGEPEVIPETETLAPPPAESEAETPETTEETAEGEQPEAEETEEKPKRESGFKRERRQRLALELKYHQAQDELQKFRDAARTKEPDKAPKEEDSNGDYLQHMAKVSAHETRKVLTETLAEERRAALEARVAQTQEELHSDFRERAAAFKEKAPDYDDVVNEWNRRDGAKFSRTLYEFVADSDVGPQLAYYLAKNPTASNKINGLPPAQASREIIKIEDMLSKPSGKPTSAVPPVKPPKGGSSGNFDPNKASMDEYVAKRNAGWRG